MRSQGAYFEGDWGVIFLPTVFLVPSSINVSIYHSTWMDTFKTDILSNYVFLDSTSKVFVINLILLAVMKKEVIFHYLETQNHLND